MSFCTNCGQELPKGTKFCANCGAPVEATRMKPETAEETEDEIASYIFEANEMDDAKSNVMENRSFKNTKHHDSGHTGRKNNKTKEKKRIPLLGIIALLLALVGFSEIRQITSEKTGTTATESSDNQKSGNTATTKSEKEEVESVENFSEFSLDGITFMIPSKYVDEGDGSFSLKDGDAIIGFYDGGEGITDENFTSTVDVIDAMMDEMAENILTECSRKSALDSKTAGFKSRTYCYTGKIDEKEGVTYFVLINNTKKNCFVFACAAASDDLQTEIEADFNEVLETAQYSNVSDMQEISDTEDTSESVAKEVEKSDSSESSGVDPDLKAFLDEYEDFVDEYVDFMQKYSKNPSDLSLLADYADIMQEYTEFAEKLDKYDSSTMSTADAAYYLEVTTRCSEKMLKVAGSIGN